MQIFVISLKAQIERRKFQKEQFKNLNLEFTFIDAISAEDIGKKTYEEHYQDWLRPLSKAEVACYYSHRMCWSLVISSNQPVLVLEDDAFLSSNIKELLDEIKISQYIDIVDLEATNRKKNISRDASIFLTDCQLSKLYLNSYGAAGYILFPSGALKLLEHEQKQGIALSDAHIASCHSLNAYQIEPASVIQFNVCQYFNILVPDYIDAKFSSLKKEKKMQKTFFFQFKRCTSEVKLGLRKLRLKLNSRRRLIHVDKTIFFVNQKASLIKSLKRRVLALKNQSYFRQNSQLNSNKKILSGSK